MPLKANVIGLGYTALLLITLSLGLVGWFFGFRLFAVPNGVVTPSALLPLAVLAGVASFFSPCVFPLLPAYVMSSLTIKTREKTHPMIGAVAAAGGVVVFLLIFGVFVGVLGEAFVRSFGTAASIVPIRRLVAVILLVLGIGHLTDALARPLHAIGSFMQRAMPVRGTPVPTGLFWYGFGYTAAGLGCTGAILGGLTLLAFTSGGLTLALVSFAVAAVTMAVLMIFIALLARGANTILIDQLKASSPTIKRAGGIILIIVAVYLVVSTFGLSI